MLNAFINLPELPIGLYYVQGLPKKKMKWLERSMNEAFECRHIIISEYDNELRELLLDKYLPKVVTVTSEKELFRTVARLADDSDTPYDKLQKLVKLYQSSNNNMKVRKYERLLIPAYEATGFNEVFLVEYATQNESVLSVVKYRAKQFRQRFIVGVETEHQENIIKELSKSLPNDRLVQPMKIY